jgi:L-lactate dehydrogenase complex protein LldG
VVEAEKAGFAMSAMVAARAAILKKLGAGTGVSGGAAPSELIPRDYIRRGSLDPDARVAKMIERLREYDAEVTECTPDGLAAEIAAQLARSGRKTFVVPSRLPPEWLAAGYNWKIDGDLATEEVESCDGVLTGCFCGVADSGTIVLHHSAAQGRRLISLLPDWHLCVLRASQIVETLPEYFDRCIQIPALVTWISGPSATADIEMTRIKGVHGPRFLNVIVVKEQGPGTRD